MLGDEIMGFLVLFFSAKKSSSPSFLHHQQMQEQYGFIVHGMDFHQNFMIFSAE